MTSLGKRRAEPEGDHLDGRSIEHDDLKAYVGGKAPEGTVDAIEGPVVHVAVNVVHPGTLDVYIGGKSRRLVHVSFTGKDHRALRSFLKEGSAIQILIDGAWILQPDDGKDDFLLKFNDSGTTISSEGSSITWDPNGS